MSQAFAAQPYPIRAAAAAIGTAVECYDRYGQMLCLSATDLHCTRPHRVQKDGGAIADIDRMSMLCLIVT